MKITLCKVLAWLCLPFALSLALVWRVLWLLSGLLLLLSVCVRQLLLALWSLEIAILAKILGLEGSKGTSNEIT